MSTNSTVQTLPSSALTLEQGVQRKPCGRLCRVAALRHNTAGEITHIQIRETHIRWKGWVTAATFSRRWQSFGASSATS